MTGKWSLVTGYYLVNKDFDDPFENTNEKGCAFAGVDLCFALRFDWLSPVVPLECFERNEVEIEALLEFGSAGGFNECDRLLPRFGDVGGNRKDFSVEAT